MGVEPTFYSLHTKYFERERKSSCVLTACYKNRSKEADSPEDTKLPSVLEWLWLIVYHYLYSFTSIFSKTRTESKQHSLKVHCPLKGHTAFLCHSDSSTRFASCREDLDTPSTPSSMEITEVTAPAGTAFQGKVTGLPLKRPITCRKLSSHKNAY